ncbi:MAG: zeta toxin family protein [Ignavibacteria bacterium]|nr:zeta toxin family protein [Ignavibacteria bacterium]
MKRIYFIAGCNGAGKTTVSITLFPELLDCTEYVNADSIAKGISPFNPDSVSFVSGRLMIDRINNLLAAGLDFAVETTLTTLSYTSLFKECVKSGYKIILIFFWLNNSRLAIKRISERVKNGGHHVPDEIVIRRYFKGINNLFDIFIPLSDIWYIYDNSDINPVLVASGGKEISTKITALEIFNEIKSIHDKPRII